MRIRDRFIKTEARVAPYAFVSPFFIVFAIFGLFPLIYTLWVSLHDWSLLAGDQGFVGFANYRELAQDADFWRALTNTIGIFVLATIPQLILATVLAQVLNSRLRGRTFWRMGVLLPNVTSVAAVGIIFGLIFARDYGIVNWALGHVGVDPIDWVERIPFTETRNYVQRVMENLQVYRTRLDGKSALLIDGDLHRGAR